jgi:hypothetical protein
MRITLVLISHLRWPSAALWADTILAGMLTHNDRASNACCLAFIRILWECLRMNEAPDPSLWMDAFTPVASQVEGITSYASRSPKLHYQGPLWQFVDREIRQAYRKDWPVLLQPDLWIRFIRMISFNLLIGLSGKRASGWWMIRSFCKEQTCKLFASC